MSAYVKCNYIIHVHIRSAERSMLKAEYNWCLSDRSKNIIGCVNGFAAVLYLL